MLIRVATPGDLEGLLAVERAAFGENEEADLVRSLLEDPTAQPVLSLVAVEDETVIGHILFTAARLDSGPADVRVTLLAPLAVTPDRQRRGVGSELVQAGLRMLEQAGVELVFVLGHPEYYPRQGFVPAGQHGLDAPYPIPDENAAAWMVHALRPERLGAVSGRVICAATLDRAEYWRE